MNISDGRLDTAKDKINELEYRSEEVIQNVVQSHKRAGNTEGRVLHKFDWNTREESQAEAIFEKLFFRTDYKDMHLQI